MQYFKSTKPEQMTAIEKEMMQKELQKAIERKQPFAKVKEGQFGQTIKVETCKLGEYSF